MVGEYRDALALADLDVPGVRAAVRSWARPGSTGEIHSGRPAVSVATCTFTSCRRCLSEQSARPSPVRSHSARVPSIRT